MPRQHVIDPAACILCEICASACTSEAISELDGRLVIDPERCDNTGHCLDVCPSGAIANWTAIGPAGPYSLAQQAGWSRLPDDDADLPRVAAELRVQA